MRQWQLILAVVTATVMLATVPAPAPACGYGMPSPAARFALADCVLVGQVLSFEGKPTKLRLAGGGEPLPHQVAVLKVVSMLKGDERLTHVRVAILGHQVMPPGFEGVFYLNAHPEESVYVFSTERYDYPIAKAGNSGFDKQVEQLRRFGQLLRHPEASLQSTNAEDRFLTAALLVTQYRTYRSDLHVQSAKTEPIDARTSRLILRALAESDWSRAAADFRLTPWRMFGMLEVEPADGLDLSSIADAKQRVDIARQWLKDNEDRFRVQTFVRR